MNDILFWILFTIGMIFEVLYLILLCKYFIDEE